MVCDSSAILAILTRETGFETLVEAIDAADSLKISAASVLELGIVLESMLGNAALVLFQRWIKRSGIEVVPVTEIHATEGLVAFRLFGKGRHPAALNFGDCFSYALAKTLGEALLFTGGYFAKTDIPPAISRKY